MWGGIQRTSSHLIPEIIVRVVLSAIVCLMQINCQPHLQHITEAELLRDYKRPRRDSYVPPWMLVGIVFSPLILLSTYTYITKNYFDFIQGLLAWTLALSINAMITETTKLMIGELRPDFFYRCFPDRIVSEGLRCTGKWQDIIEGRKSFPSGHSSFSFCSLGFMSLWLSGKLGIISWNRGNGVYVIVCIIPLFIASIIAMSRICDHHHHMKDVIFGSVLGYLCSYFCYFQYYNSLNSEQSVKNCIDKGIFKTNSTILNSRISTQIKSN